MEHTWGKGGWSPRAQTRGWATGWNSGQPNSSEAKYLGSWHSSGASINYRDATRRPVRSEFTSLMYFTEVGPAHVCLRQVDRSYGILHKQILHKQIQIEAAGCKAVQHMASQNHLQSSFHTEPQSLPPVTSWPHLFRPIVNVYKWKYTVYAIQ